MKSMTPNASHTLPALAAGLMTLISACDGGRPRNTSRAMLDAGPASSDGGTHPVPQPDDGVIRGPVDPTVAAPAAILGESCFPDDAISNLLESWYYTRRQVSSSALSVGNATLRCLAQARTCDAAGRCLGVTITEDPSCQEACSGDTQVICRAGKRFALDCSRNGGTCEAGECVPPDEQGPTCDSSTFKERCDQGQPVFCATTERRGPVCAELNPDLACTVEDGTVACRGTGGTCQWESITPSRAVYDEGIECRGQRLAACVSGGIAEVDCSTLGTGFTCQTLGDRAFCGLAAECDPTMDTNADGCDGTRVQFCNAGRVDSVDCATLGFTGCAFGRCTPSAF